MNKRAVLVGEHMRAYDMSAGFYCALKAETVIRFLQQYSNAEPSSRFIVIVKNVIKTLLKKSNFSSDAVSFFLSCYKSVILLSLKGQLKCNNITQKQNKVGLVIKKKCLELD